MFLYVLYAALHVFPICTVRKMFARAAIASDEVALFQTAATQRLAPGATN